MHIRDGGLTGRGEGTPREKGRLMANEALISKVPLFTRLDKGSLRKLAALCIPRQFPKGKLLIKQGETGLGLFLITAGRVEVYFEQGGMRTRLAILEPGDSLGEMSLVDDAARSTSAEALEDTECILLTRDGFSALRKEEPEVPWLIMSSLADKLREANQRLVDLEAKAAAEAARRSNGGSKTEEGGSAMAETTETSRTTPASGVMNVAGRGLSLAVSLSQLAAASWLLGAQELLEAVGQQEPPLNERLRRLSEVLTRATQELSPKAEGAPAEARETAPPPPGEAAPLLGEGTRYLNEALALSVATVKFQAEQLRKLLRAEGYGPSAAIEATTEVVTSLVAEVEKRLTGPREKLFEAYKSLIG